MGCGSSLQHPTAQGGAAEQRTRISPGSISNPSAASIKEAASLKLEAEAEPAYEDRQHVRFTSETNTSGKSNSIAPLRGPMLAMASFHSKGSSFGRDDTIECGVSMSWLEEFASHIDPGMTTEEVVRDFILPETKEDECRYADLVPIEFLGVPEFFVSHMWSSTFKSTVDALKSYIGTAHDLDEVIVWLDIFAINQHPACAKSKDLNTLTRIIKASKKTLLCLDREGNALERLWVLYEVWQTVVSKTAHGLNVLPAHDTDYALMQRAFNRIDVKHSKATLEVDRDRLLGGIKGSISHTALSHVIKKALGDSVLIEAQEAVDQIEAESSDLAEVLLQCGRFLKVCGRYKDAEDIVRRTLTIFKHTLGYEHDSTSKTLNCLGTLLHLQGQYCEAEVHLFRALAIDEGSFGIDHLSTFCALHSLGVLLQDQGKLSEAEPLLRRVLSIQEKREPAASPAEISSSLLNLAKVLQKLDQKEEAESLARRALALLEQCYGQDGYPQTTKAVSSVAGLLLGQGKSEEAEALYRRALEHTKAAVGDSHQDTAACQAQLAMLLASQEKLEEAGALISRAHSICDKALGPNHATNASYLASMASILKQQGKMDAALPHLRHVVLIHEKTLGPDNLGTADSLIALAETLQELGAFKDSESLFRRALKIQEKALGSNNPVALKNRRRVSHVVSEWSMSAAKQHS